MYTEEIILAVISGAFALEFIIFSCVILNDIRICYVYEICISKSQKAFYTCIFIITLLRIFYLVLASMAYHPAWISPVACLEIIVGSYVFSIILYLWYYLHRWKVYLSNSYHLSNEEKRAKELIMKRFIIYIDLFNIFVFLGCCIFIILGYDDIEKGDYFYFSLRLYQIYITSVFLSLVYFIGIKLLRQIKKYAYATPHILILSLYFSLSGFTAGLICVGFAVALPEEYRGYSNLVAYIISENFILLIPFWMFHIFLKRHHTCRPDDNIFDTLNT